MNHRNLRIIIIFGTLVIACLLVVQVFWFKRAFDIREKQFDHSVQVALKEVSDSLSDTKTHTSKINKLSSNFFLVKMNAPLKPELVDSLIRKAFSMRSLSLAYELGIYNAIDDTIVYGNYIQGIRASHVEKDVMAASSDFGERRNFAVYFPSKKSYLAAELNIWIFSSLVLVLMTSFFAYAIWSLLREKRFAEMKNDFINNMTHELKTPVTNIQIANDVLAQKSNNDGTISKYLEIIKLENDKLKKRIDQVLSTATQAKYNYQPELEPVDLHDILTSCAETFKMKIQQRGGKITLKLKAGEYMCYGDRKMLTEAFNNIIDNAEKYARNKPEICITSENHEDAIMLGFEDNGLGIPKEDQKLIFDKFFRGQRGDIHNVKGFGLGLNIVKSIIRAHKGKVSLVSDIHKGTRLAIKLPL